MVLVAYVNQNKICWWKTRKCNEQWWQLGNSFRLRAMLNPISDDHLQKMRVAATERLNRAQQEQRREEEADQVLLNAEENNRKVAQLRASIEA